MKELKSEGIEKSLQGKAREAFENNQMEEVLAILKNAESENDVSVLYLKGEACYHLQRWGDSLNYFRKVIEKEPSDKKARAYIEMINNILSFYHTDFFNP